MNDIPTMRSAVDADPMNHSLRGILADALEESGQAEEAARQRVIARACFLTARRVALTVDQQHLPSPLALRSHLNGPWLIIPALVAPKRSLPGCSRDPYYPPSSFGPFPGELQPMPGQWVTITNRRDHPFAGTVYVHPDDPTASALLALAVSSVKD